METNHCPVCRSPIPENAPGGFCPACLLRGAEDAPSFGPAAPSIAEIAAAFPRLEVMELIGQGGMGFVYKARQPDLDRTIALKILAPELGRDPAFAERFAREARTLGKLHHPNIVTVFEHGKNDGFFYLIMEYVDGVNLRQAMRAGRFTPEQALAIVPGICDALQYAHKQGMWHRDIKPENILLDREGKVKIADFGIARIVGDPRRDFTLTMTGNALGSAAYMAPEQHEKPHDVDHRADIYSLGVVIYEMLTGELPLGRFPLPSQRAEVNARIDEIVLQTLEKERELRQQSATEVKTDVMGAAVAPDSRTSAQNNPADHRSPKLPRWSLVCLFVGALLWVAAFGLAEPIRRATESRDWFPKIYVDQDSSWMLGALGTIAVLLRLSAVFSGVGLLGFLWTLWRRSFSGPAVQEEREFRQQSAAEVKTDVHSASRQKGSGEVPAPSKSSVSAKLACGLLVGGALGFPLLAGIGMRADFAAAFGVLCVVLACVLGVVTWRERLGKFVLLASGCLLLLCVLFITWNTPSLRVRREPPTTTITVLQSAKFDFTHPDKLTGGTGMRIPIPDFPNSPKEQWFPEDGQPITLKDGKQILVRVRVARNRDGTLDAFAASSDDGKQWETQGVSLEAATPTKQAVFKNGTKVTIRFLTSSGDGMTEPAQNRDATPAPASPNPPPPATAVPAPVPTVSPEEVFRKANAAANESNGEEFGVHMGQLQLTYAPLPIPVPRVPVPPAPLPVGAYYPNSGTTLERMALFIGEIVNLKVTFMGGNPSVSRAYGTIRKPDGSLVRLVVEFQSLGGRWIGARGWLPPYRASSRIEFKPEKGDATTILKTHLGSDLAFRAVEGKLGMYDVFSFYQDADQARADADVRVEGLQASLEKFGLGSALKVISPAEKPEVPYMGENEPPFQTPRAAMEEIIRAAKEKDKQALKRRCSQSLIAIADDDGPVDQIFNQLPSFRVIGERVIDASNAEVIIESPTDDNKSTFRMVQEDGMWKLTEKVEQHR